MVPSSNSLNPTEYAEMAHLIYCVISGKLQIIVLLVICSAQDEVVRPIDNDLTMRINSSVKLLRVLSADAGGFYLLGRRDSVYVDDDCYCCLEFACCSGHQHSCLGCGEWITFRKRGITCLSDTVRERIEHALEH